MTRQHEPLEPLYTLKVAAEMIPMRCLQSLRSFLFSHRTDFPPRYRRAPRGYVRLLSLSECHRIRAIVVKPVRKHSDSPFQPKRSQAMSRMK